MPGHSSRNSIHRKGFRMWRARLNLQVWKEHAFIRENYSEKTIRDLDSALEAIARERAAASDIEWGMRQIIFQRR